LIGTTKVLLNQTENVVDLCLIFLKIFKYKNQGEQRGVATPQMVDGKESGVTTSFIEGVSNAFL